MSIKVTTLHNLAIAVLEARGSIIGGDETDELKVKARDLVEQGNRKLVLDLSNVTYLNSSGIGAVVSIHTMYTKAGGGIKVCGLGKGVKNVFVITSLTRVIDVEETRDEAIQKFETATVQ
jgi:anti-sigma B factor antagonist